MKEEHLASPSVRKKKYSSYAGEISPEVENLINRDFRAETPNSKWLTDITEFNISAGKVRVPAFTFQKKRSKDVRGKHYPNRRVCGGF